MSARIETYHMRLEGIRFRGRHGASRAERGLLQDFVATVELELPPSSLPRNDSLKGVYDYGKLSDIVVAEGTESSHKLLETLAERLIDRILEASPAMSVTVRITKFGPPTAASVDAASIELTGSRRP